LSSRSTSLLEVLAHRGPDVGSRQLLRIFGGTGIIGGFTTYSALAVDTAQLTHNGQIVAAAAYSLATLVVGRVASLGGILSGQHCTRGTTPR